MIARPDPSEASVRPLRGEDVAQVVAIEAASFSTPWSEETFSGLLGRQGVELLALEHPDTGLIGYAVLWCILDQGELANVAVAPAWRGMGLGRLLMERVVEVARTRGVRRLFLEVRASNARALGIYERAGFVDVGVRKAYYTDPREDARVMMLAID